MTHEERLKLIEMGTLINIKITPFEKDGEIGVHYMDFESFTYATVLRDLLTIKAQKEARRD